MILAALAFLFFDREERLLVLLLLVVFLGGVDCLSFRDVLLLAFVTTVSTGDLSFPFLD